MLRSGGLPGGVGADAVDVGEVLAAERAAVDGHARAVEVDYQLAAGPAVVAVGAGLDQGAVGVDEQGDVVEVRDPARVGLLQLRVGGGEGVGDARDERHAGRCLTLLQGDEHVLELPAWAFFPQPHEELTVWPFAGESTGMW